MQVLCAGMECYVHQLSLEGDSVFLDRELASRPQHRKERILGTTLEMIAVVIKGSLVHMI